jgi:hypothetical protein
MCGIIGIVGAISVQERLIESLKRLEYRGYDSAGVAGVVGGKVQRRRARPACRCGRAPSRPSPRRFPDTPRRPNRSRDTQATAVPG